MFVDRSTSGIGVHLVSDWAFREHKQTHVPDMCVGVKLVVTIGGYSVLCFGLIPRFLRRLFSSFLFPILIMPPFFQYCSHHEPPTTIVFFFFFNLPLRSAFPLPNVLYSIARPAFVDSSVSRQPPISWPEHGVGLGEIATGSRATGFRGIGLRRSWKEDDGRGKGVRKAFLPGNQKTTRNGIHERHVHGERVLQGSIGDM